MLSPANSTSEEIFLERITTHKLLLHKQTALHARVLQAMGGICPQVYLLPELGPMPLQQGDTDFGSGGGKCGHWLSPVSCPAQYTTKLFLALPAYLQGPIKISFC